MKLISAAVSILMLAELGIAATPADPRGAPGQASAQAILTATDPSAAVSAFTQAIAASPNDPAAYSAYVRKMVDFGMPQSAFLQAQTLVKLDPRSGLGWAVTANWAATQNDYRNALSYISRAAELSPNDPFVSRMAAQITGWYDTNYKYADLPKEYRLVLSRVGEKMAGTPVYAAAYQSAMIEFANAKAGIVSTDTKPVCPVISTASNLYGPAYQKPVVPQLTAMPPIVQTQQPVYPTTYLQQMPPQYVQPPVSPSLIGVYGLPVPVTYLPGLATNIPIGR